MKTTPTVPVTFCHLSPRFAATLAFKHFEARAQTPENQVANAKLNSYKQQITQLFRQEVGLTPNSEPSITVTYQPLQGWTANPNVQPQPTDKVLIHIAPKPDDTDNNSFLNDFQIQDFIPGSPRHAQLLKVLWTVMKDYVSPALAANYNQKLAALSTTSQNTPRASGSV
ncbi:MAG: hypothetical protein SFZ03_00350 [Candidatus Melainabacteria bacterium]|nr:hypothetical protein [Candidatus Melainabacteria bacterium]